MAADAILSFDDEHRIVIFNAAAERIFGWRADEILGEAVDLLIPGQLADTHRRHVAAFDRTPGLPLPMQSRGPFLARRSDGSQFPAEISISRLTEDGRHVYTAVLRDITTRVLQEARIARLTRLNAVLSEVNATIVRVLNATLTMRLG